MQDEILEMDNFDRSSASYDLPAAITDIGCEREINEDRYACFTFGESSVWLVCDGMGGAVGGELAAQLAVDTIKKVLEADPHNISHELVAHAFNEANRVVVLRRQNPAFSGMGTTIVGGLITPNYISFFHAGDSRAYIISDSSINQVTTDHTYVQDLVSRGMISETEALSHPQSHVLTRCLGSQLKLDYDSKKCALSKTDDRGQILVLCSDGLYSLISDEEIQYYVLSFAPQNACAKLVELARSRGGFDNITIGIIPLFAEVDLEGRAEIVQEKPKAPPRNAQVFSRENHYNVKKISSLKKILILSVLGILSALGVILGVMLL